MISENFKRKKRGSTTFQLPLLILIYFFLFMIFYELAYSYMQRSTLFTAAQLIARSAANNPNFPYEDFRGRCNAAFNAIGPLPPGYRNEFRDPLLANLTGIRSGIIDVNVSRQGTAKTAAGGNVDNGPPLSIEELANLETPRTSNVPLPAGIGIVGLVPGLRAGGTRLTNVEPDPANPGQSRPFAQRADEIREYNACYAVIDPARRTVSYFVKLHSPAAWPMFAQSLFTAFRRFFSGDPNSPVFNGYYLEATASALSEPGANFDSGTGRSYDLESLSQDGGPDRREPYGQVEFNAGPVPYLECLGLNCPNDEAQFIHPPTGSYLRTPIGTLGRPRRNAIFTGISTATLPPYNGNAIPILGTEYVRAVAGGFNSTIGSIGPAGLASGSESPAQLIGVRNLRNAGSLDPLIVVGARFATRTALSTSPNYVNSVSVPLTQNRILTTDGTDQPASFNGMFPAQPVALPGAGTVFDLVNFPAPPAPANNAGPIVAIRNTPSNQFNLICNRTASYGNQLLDSGQLQAAILSTNLSACPLSSCVIEDNCGGTPDPEPCGFFVRVDAATMISTVAQVWSNTPYTAFNPMNVRIDCNYLKQCGCFRETIRRDLVTVTDPAGNTTTTCETTVVAPRNAACPAFALPPN